MKNTYKQLIIKREEAIEPLRKLYPYSYEDSCDGFFLGSYELHETLRYVDDEEFPELNKPAIKNFIELHKQYNKIKEPTVPDLLNLFGATMEEASAEYEKKMEEYYSVAIPLLEKLLAATPPFVRAMYAYNGKTAPASI